MKGVYILIISVSENVKVNAGKLGAATFHKGFYAYVGSGQKNLEKRIARHLRKSKKTFWHIDYLLGNKYVKVTEAFWKETGRAEECKTAKKLSKISLSVPGFGCSDCSCKSHLFFLENYGPSDGVWSFLKGNYSDWRVSDRDDFADSTGLQ